MGEKPLDQKFKENLVFGDPAQIIKEKAHRISEAKDIYTVRVSYEGEEIVHVRAKSEEEAKERVRDMDFDMDSMECKYDVISKKVVE